MSYFYERLHAHIKQLSPPMTFYKLHFLSEVGTSQFSAWKTGRRAPSDSDIKRLAAANIGLTEETLFAWRAIDEYSVETLKIACRELEEHPVELIKGQAQHQTVEEDDLELSSKTSRT